MHPTLSGRLLAASLGACLALGAGVAGAQTFDVGPGTGIANDENDTAGGRINVDQGNPVTLEPGEYTATLFNFDAGVAGDVTPFLATGGAGNQYTVIAVGTDQTVAVGQDQSLAFGGSNTFTITTPTQVFAGIASDTQNPIALDNGTGPNTDHEGGGQPAGSYVITLGGTVPPDGAFSNPDLGRSYAFSVSVQLIPEPSAFALGALGLGFLGCRMRRRR